MGRRTAMGSGAEAVRVVVRCRPMSDGEQRDKRMKVIDVDSSSGTMRINNPAAASSEPPKMFTFDGVYGPFSKQKEVFNETALPIVDAVLRGFNGTIFAYGQTGTGKTWTMAGSDKSSETKGIIPNSFEHIFNTIGRSQEKQYLVRASYLEIYQNEIRDLLDKSKKGTLDLHESKDHGVYVKGLTSFVVKSISEIEHVMKAGDPNRSVGATKMNAASSRSHSIFTITIECSTPLENGKSHICAGKLNLVDLAGSERQAKTEATGQRLAEATKINLSLSALGNVISALVDGKSSHIPYRDSRLTRLLEDSLGGNAKTVMIATLGPADYNYSESLNTLRYANRAKNIKNKPTINEDPKDALLRKYQEEIELLKQKLTSEGKKIGGGGKRKGRRRKKTKKRVVNSDGESEEITDSEDDGSGNSVDEDEVERRIAESRSELEREREKIMRNKNILREERDQLLQTLDDRADELEREMAQYNDAAKKLKAMEEKLLVGGVNIFDRTQEQERELQEQEQMLAARKQREVELRQKIEKEEEMKLQVEEKFATLEEEVAVKTKKLKKLWSKLMAARTEIKDLREENRSKREELNETQRALSKDLALQTIIIDNFIPIEEKEKIEKRAEKNAEGEWYLKKIVRADTAQRVKRPVSAIGQKRPISEYARAATALGDTNPRYRSENIMQVELDMPDRTTSDYHGPKVPSYDTSRGLHQSYYS